MKRDPADSPSSLKSIEWIGGHEWIPAAYLLLALALSWAFSFTIDFTLLVDFSYDFHFLSLLIFFVTLTLLVTGARAPRTDGDSRLFGPRWRARIFREYLTPQLAWDTVRALLLIKLVLVIYCNIKQAIPRIHPQTFDEDLERLDILLHLGFDPLRVPVYLADHPIITGAIDFLYVVWYFVKAPMVVIFLLVRNRRLHVGFYGAYLSIWIVGGLFAVAFPSLGPIYTHPELYESLNKPFATGFQERLWTHYQQMLAAPEEYQALIYEGIAAFPSLHVAVVALFAFFLGRVHRGAAALMWAFTVVIQFGSVLLGWHYAVDGYFGILLAYVLYRLATRALRIPASDASLGARDD